MANILVVEDTPSMRNMLVSILEERGHVVFGAGDVAAALLLLNKESVDLILSDLQLPDATGLTLFQRVRHTRLPFIILTAFGSIETAVDAIKQGAWDFIAKPVDPDYLLLVIDKALAATRAQRENIILREVLISSMQQPTIIGQSPAILREAEKIRRVAATDTPVILIGESGTGKELFARALHNLSPRREQPFIAINSAAIPEALLESELFGHEKGSFTGAHLRQLGKLEMAQGGTFFFDEIGDLPLSLQSKLLRVIEERRIQRIGGLREIDLDIRFVFATNQDLQQAVAEKRFRADLYFRLQVFPIVLPPLRERPEDIDLLTEYFLKKYAQTLKKIELRLEETARAKLHRYHWPGNVRELQNVIERAVIVCRDETVRAADIILLEKPVNVIEPIGLDGTLRQVSQRARRWVEKRKIEEVMAETGFNRGRAAEILDVSYKTLVEKIEEYDIRPPL